MKLDPEGVRRRKEEARKEGRRVEARRELSGNMSFGARELATEEALAAKAVIDTDAIALRNAGLEGSLRDLRVMAYLDRTNGRDPLARVTGARPAQDGSSGRDDCRVGRPVGPQEMDVRKAPVCRLLCPLRLLHGFKDGSLREQCCGLDGGQVAW